MTDTGSGSIIRRLVLASLLTLPLFLGITGYAIDQAHSRSLLAAQQSQLQLQFYGILGVMEWSNTQPLSVDRLREPRFWQFRSGLYAFIHSRNGVLQWQSSSANTMEYLHAAYSPLGPGQEVFDTTRIRDEDFFRYRYHIIWEDEHGVDYPLIFTLLQSQDTYKAEVLSFRQNTALWLSMAGIVLLLIQIAVMRWGLTPLGKMSRELHALETGESERLGSGYPRELVSITRNLNRLLEKEQQQRERYRNTLGDLAHSLKTPLSVIRSATDRNRDPLLNEQLDKMNNIIAYQLQRAVSAGPHQLGVRTSVKPLLKRLLNSLDKVYREKALAFTLNCGDADHLSMDEQDLMELLGNLLDNACKAARHNVSVNFSQQQSKGNSAVLTIEDDGPGFPEDKIETLLQRGSRGDQYGSGQGLGLSVAMDILNAYQGEIDIARSSTGGAKLILTLPQ